MRTFFDDEVEDRLYAGSQLEHVYEDIFDLLDEGRYYGSELAAVKHGLIRVGYLVEIPEPAKREEMILSGGKSRTMKTNRDLYDVKFGKAYYVVQGTEDRA